MKQSDYGFLNFQLCTCCKIRLTTDYEKDSSTIGQAHSSITLDRISQSEQSYLANSIVSGHVMQNYLPMKPEELFAVRKYEHRKQRRMQFYALLHKYHLNFLCVNIRDSSLLRSLIVQMFESLR